MFARLRLAAARAQFDHRMKRSAPVRLDVRLHGPLFVLTSTPQTWTTGQTIRLTFKES